MGHFRWVARWGGGSPEKKKVAQNLLKHALVLEFFEIRQNFFTGWGGGGVKK